MSQKPNSKPLETVLSKISKARGDIAGAEQRGEALKTEVDSFLSNADPDDESALKAISGKQLQMQIIPGLIGRKQRELGQLEEELRTEISKFEQALCDVGLEENAKLTAELDRRTAAFFPGQKFSVGNVVYTITSIPIHPNQLVDMSVRVNAGLSFEMAIRYAAQLMEIHKEWQKVGDCYRPEIWKALRASKV